MRKCILILIICCSYSFAHAQEWGSVDGNTVTVNELPPIWPGCEEGTLAEKDECFDKKLAQHIYSNFKYPQEEYKNKIEGKVTVTFLINEEGLVEIQEMEGGNEGLQAEAKRNILLIPKMTSPGMQGGRPKSIQIKVPFDFKINR